MKTLTSSEAHRHETKNSQTGTEKTYLDGRCSFYLNMRFKTSLATERNHIPLTDYQSLTKHDRKTCEHSKLHSRCLLSI